VAVALLAAMFVAFIIQIAFRYLLNFPIGWTSELTVAAWLWIVLWGAAFVLREREEVRFDLIYSAVGRRARRGFAIVTALALVGLYGYALPASADYVAFMKVQSTTYLKIRYDHLYSIFVIFAAAIIARYLWILWRALRGGPYGDAADASASGP
jgi:TRAP-type C4-dicarboxylate transport system permease small subunit